jgi:hypothetical protein
MSDYCAIAIHTFICWMKFSLFLFSSPSVCSVPSMVKVLPRLLAPQEVEMR